MVFIHTFTLLYMTLYIIIQYIHKYNGSTGAFNTLNSHILLLPPLLARTNNDLLPPIEELSNGKFLKAR